jgi:MFS family permease
VTDTAAVAPAVAAAEAEVGAIDLLIAQSGVPSPLYPVYQHRLHLAPVATTAIFSIYIAGLLGSLLTVGRLSDHIGRRPAIIGSAVLSACALVLFATAGSLAQLLVARFVQGIAVGGGMSAVGAAMIDLAPARLVRLAGVLNGAMPPAGLAVGALVNGAFVQGLPDPTTLVYLVFAAALMVTMMTATFFAESHPRRPIPRSVLIPRVQVPVPTRRAFVAVIGTMIASWALGAFTWALAHRFC